MNKTAKPNGHQTITE